MPDPNETEFLIEDKDVMERLLTTDPSKLKGEAIRLILALLMQHQALYMSTRRKLRLRAEDPASVEDFPDTIERNAIALADIHVDRNDLAHLLETLTDLNINYPPLDSEGAAALLNDINRFTAQRIAEGLFHKQTIN